MWSPTHIQVTVKAAKGLLTKGKNGTNNCFVTIALGKEKYQTSVKEKAISNVDWNEECELKIPDQGNRAELVLTCLHHNNLGIDEFLGQVTLPLNEMDVYDRPRSKWFRLESKPGKEKKNKERGELEVRISFVVKSGSLTDLSKKDKHKSSIGQLASSVGGSLLSIGTIEKRKGIKKFAKSLGSKMHLNGKKKNKEGDDVSISGSFASIGTPNSSNGGSRRYGQHVGEADPGVISEDEDEFVFDNLSHKSSGSSLNIRSGLQPPTSNFVPRNPSPLLNNNGKIRGKQQLLTRHNVGDEDLVVDPELEAIENDFSVRARTLPPPSKPPRTPQLGGQAASPPKAVEKEPQLDEWATKLYGGKHLEIGSSDSLKRRSWEPACVPLPTATEEDIAKDEHNGAQQIEKEISLKTSSATESDSDSSTESEVEAQVKMPEPAKLNSEKSNFNEPPKRPQEIDLANTPKVTAQSNLLLSSPEVERNGFDEYNATFAKFEQRNKAAIFDFDADKKWHTRSFIEEEAKPQAKPRNREREAELRKAEEEKEKNEKEEEQRQRAAQAEAEAAAATAAAEKAAKLNQQIEEQRRRAAEDARLEAELRLNEQRLRDEELAMQAEIRQREAEEQKRREAKRREEDQRILNFVRQRSTSIEGDSSSTANSTPEQSPKERVLSNGIGNGNGVDSKREKRLGKFKYMNKRDKNEDDNTTAMPKSNERIIIGHEKSMSHAERRSEVTAALAKKYDGKSREELMLIANGMENEALIQRQRVKELEDYLDNLLLRVMETHPKILQNPYSRTTSAKSG